MTRFFIFICMAMQMAWAEVPKVVVSIAPTKYLVNRIAEGRVSVLTFVPQGASPHSYEPSARQLMEASTGVLWFCIGEGFEGKALEAVKGRAQVVKLYEGLDLIEEKGCCCLGNHDPHIWLSPRLVKVQAGVIAQALCAHFPQHAPLFEENLHTLLTDLDALDSQLHALLDPCTERTILVSHSAFGYFCRDYGFKQLSIEHNGKEPTTRYLNCVLEAARKEGINKVIIEPQHSTKAALRLASELKVVTIPLDPYKEDLMENLKTIAKAFVQ